MRRIVAFVALLAVPTLLSAQAPQRRGGRSAAPAPVAGSTQCASDLGPGLKSGKEFCDVVMSVSSAESIIVTVPPHKAAVRLHFDLHNRFAVPPEQLDPGRAFARHTALVAVIGPKAEIGRAVATGEFRSVNDLFDRISGGAGRGNVKAVAPGAPTAIEMTIPSSITTVGIVGIRLEVTTRLGRQVFDSPGRPIALVSNVRIDTAPPAR
jgi:hypothetical protein